VVNGAFGLDVSVSFRFREEALHALSTVTGYYFWTNELTTLVKN